MNPEQSQSTKKIGEIILYGLEYLEVQLPLSFSFSDKKSIDPSVEFIQNECIGVVFFKGFLYAANIIPLGFFKRSVSAIIPGTSNGSVNSFILVKYLKLPC